MKILIAVLSFSFLFACKKKDQVSGTKSSLLIVNASPNAGKLRVFQNLQPTGGEYDYIKGLTQTNLQYFFIDSGFSNFKIKKGAAELVSIPYANTSNQLSLWMYDTAAKLRYLFLNDQLDTPGRAFAKVRVLHLSPNVDTFQLLLNNAVVATTGNVPVNWTYYSSQQKVITDGVANFFKVDSGNFTIAFRQKNPQQVLKSYNLRLEGNKVYSLVLKGYQNRAGADSLSASILQH